jgi:hypothetical protein
MKAEKAYQSPEAKSTDASATPGFAVKTQSAPLYAPEQVEMQACPLWQASISMKIKASSTLYTNQERKKQADGNCRVYG